MKKLLQTFIIVAFALILCYASNAQTVCISQESANKARDNALELEAVKAKVAVLEQGLTEKDKTIVELQNLNDKNVADLKESLRRTETELSVTKGQLISRESEIVRQSEIIKAMIPMLRAKKIGLINF